MLDARPLLVASAVALAIALGAPNSARANGRFPTAQHVIVGPADASSVVVLRTTFGLVVSDDGGATFRYICEDAEGYAGTAFDPAVVLEGSGRLLNGLYDGAMQTSLDRCSYDRIATLKGEFISDLDTNGGKVVVASTATGFIERTNHLWRSEDGGDTFKELGAGVLGVQFETLELAKTNDKRLYATALQLSPRRVVAYRSDDGGATLIDLKGFPQPDSIDAFISGVDPTNADVVYVRVVVTGTSADGGTTRQTALLRSEDAGVTWKEVVRSKGQMLGFAIKDDGKTLWFGGPDDGLQRSTDRGATWTTLATPKVQCLRYHAGKLYLCAQGEVDGYALADSCDEGTTLRPILAFKGVAGTFACPSTSPEGSTCVDRFTMLGSVFPDAGPTLGLGCGGFDAALDGDGDTRRDDVDANDATDAPDASAPDVAAIDSSIDDASPPSDANGGGTESSSGCGCRLAGATSGDLALLAVAGAALVATRRRRRR